MQQRRKKIPKTALRERDEIVANIVADMKNGSFVHLAALINNVPKSTAFNGLREKFSRRRNI